jgi:DHA2 family multidrug resistance protein-like MFS transporter
MPTVLGDTSDDALSPGSHRWWALGAVFLTILCVGVDSTVLSVALPTLANSLHASETDLQWFSSGYFLVLAAAMLPAGLLGDRYGHKKVFLVSLAVFAVGSAACALSTSVAEFMVARVLLGLAGAGIIVMAISSLTVLFDKEERPKAVGVLGAGNFLALPLGPILGGWLLTNYWWGWVFLINVPIALIGLVAAAALLPEFRAAEHPGLDLIGIGASVIGLAAVTYGLIRAGADGWSDPVSLLMIVVGIAMVIGFLAWEHRLTRGRDGQPLLDMTLFSSASFTWGSILAALSFLALIGVLFTLPQYFQGVLGTTAMGSGLRLLPLVGGVLLGAIPAAVVAKRLGTKVAVAAGFLLLAAGLCLGATTNGASTETFVAVWMVVVGAGMGLALATSTSAALVELSPERSGVGSGVLEAIDEVGGPLGIAILGSVVGAGYVAHLDLSGLSGPLAATVRQSVFAGVAAGQKLHSPQLIESVRYAFVHGMQLAFLVSAGISVVGALLTVIFLPRSNASMTSDQPGREADPGSANSSAPITLDHDVRPRVPYHQ